MQARNWDAAQESENRASGFCSSQGSHSRGGEQPLLQWGSQRLAGKGREIGGLPTCGPRSCSWSYIWRESGKPLQSARMLLSAMGTLSLEPPPKFWRQEPSPGTGKQTEVVSRRRAPSFLYAESIFLFFSLLCELECYLQLKRSTDNEFFFWVQRLQHVWSDDIVSWKKIKRRKAYWLSAWRWLLGSFPFSVPGLKPDMHGIGTPLRILTQPWSCKGLCLWHCSETLRRSRVNNLRIKKGFHF